MLEQTKTKWRQLLGRLEMYFDNVEQWNPASTAAMRREISAEIGRGVAGLAAIVILSAMGVMAVWWGM